MGLFHMSNLPPPPPPYSICDTETYPNYWLCMFDTGETFEMYEGHPLDVVGLRAALSRYTVVTFNGQHYDIPMISLALTGVDCATMKRANDVIIPGGGMKGPQGWQFIRDYGLPDPAWIDHIDLFDVAPGVGSLKAYGGKMHSRKLQDLPFDPAELITPAKRRQLIEYCGNDLRTTRDLLESFPSQLALRRDMSAEYGVDLRSKSDAQIAEAVMKKLLPFKVQRPDVPCGTRFNYRPPTWMAFATPALQRVLAELVRHPFSVNDKGSPVADYHNHLIDWGDEQFRLDPHNQWIKRPKDWKHELVHVGESAYSVGSGGLHSTESKTAHAAAGEWVISDHDVASYYPSLILVTGIAPVQIGSSFAEIYRSWYTRRLAAKRAGDKKNANSLKTLLNGTFGKLGSKWSIFYAPAEMIQVTVTGQLALLMLIERLELCGIRVISANTDGIVVKCTPARLWLRDACIKWWETVTGLETEESNYRLLASRDVNSYVALTVDNKVKTKGAFAPPEPGPSGWPNPTGQIAVDAAVAYLQHGAPIEQTVRGCTDVRQFVHVRQVQGGGSYSPLASLDRTATQKRMRELCGDLPKDDLVAAYDALRAARLGQVQYLGRIVRWYYGAGSEGCILTPKGSLVARTHGARPLMELTDTVPADMDYDWYIREAQSLLEDLGIARPVN